MNIRLLLLFFFLSGFCSLVYEVVWVRLSMAAFGCNAPLVSIVLSVFMAGLGLGSYIAARLRDRLDGYNLRRVLTIYACCELFIAIGGFVVGILIGYARALLEDQLKNIEWASAGHYGVVLLFITAIVLPFTTAMGMTLPIGMGIVRRSGVVAVRSFSFLYVANLLGATCGTLLTALVLVEHLGFRGTLGVPILINVSIGVLALLVAQREGSRPTSGVEGISPPVPVKQVPSGAVTLLFLTGMITMGVEIVWFRLYTAYLETSVYAFAKILSVYLLTNFLGSLTYRRNAEAGLRIPLLVVLSVAGAGGIFTLLCTDFFLPTEVFTPNLRLILGVAPFSFVMGYLTPLLVDDVSGGAPNIAGKAYAMNIAGCILGPLVTSFVLLPNLSEKTALGFLILPLFIWAAKELVRNRREGRVTLRVRLVCYCCVVAAILMWSGTLSVYDAMKLKAEGNVLIERDFEATTVAIGGGARDQLLVNGYGMTVKHPVTKVMAHLPMALLARAPDDVLVICFGMGTTFRSALSWGARVDVVDLVPGVPKVFPMFHRDAEQVAKNPRGRIIVDDGRRYLQRTTRSYDVITLDPPPPVEAAATSLLYSKEFYSIAKRRLKVGGILQHWVPGTSAAVRSSMVRSAREVFKYVSVFGSFEGGIHITCSDVPLPPCSAEQLAKKLPPEATKDLLEWTPQWKAVQVFGFFLSREFSSKSVADAEPNVYTLSDDRPFNEYYLIRTQFPKWWNWWSAHTIRASQ
ncbi:MAG: hypothetical protein QM790_06785 [Nibricoccus sp.]